MEEGIYCVFFNQRCFNPFQFLPHVEEEIELVYWRLGLGLGLSLGLGLRGLLIDSHSQYPNPWLCSALTLIPVFDKLLVGRVNVCQINRSLHTVILANFYNWYIYSQFEEEILSCSHVSLWNHNCLNCRASSNGFNNLLQHLRSFGRLFNNV